MILYIKDLGRTGRTAYEPCYNWVKIENDKIVDMAVGTQYAGCRCDGNTNCESYAKCLKQLYDNMTDENKRILKSCMAGLK